MFSDPLVLSLYGSVGDATFTKINQDGYASVYRLASSTHEARLTIRHSKTKATASKPAMDRHNIEITDVVYATSTVPEYTRKCYLVAEGLPGDNLMFNLVCGAAGWLLADSAAAVTKLRNWES